MYLLVSPTTSDLITFNHMLNWWALIRTIAIIGFMTAQYQ